jgi:hypothetical protein
VGSQVGGLTLRIELDAVPEDLGKKVPAAVRAGSGARN